MKIVRILGGLGNQMWQYAFLVSLRNHFPNDEVMYDAGFFNGYHLHNGFELTRIYNITAQQAPKQEIRRLYHYFNNHYLFTRLYRHYFPLKKNRSLGG